MKFRFAIWQRSPRNKLAFICETERQAVEYIKKQQEKHPEYVFEIKEV